MNPAAIALAVLAWYAAKQPEPADLIMARVALKNPTLLLPLADICTSLGKTASAQSWATAAVKAFRSRTEEKPGDEASPALFV